MSQPGEGQAGSDSNDSLDLDLEVKDRRKAERHRHHKIVTVPRLRVVGFAFMAFMIPIHNHFFQGDPTWGNFRLFCVIGLAYSALSWGTIYLLHERVWRGFGIDDLFLVADLGMVCLLVLLTGAEKSLLSLIFLFRIGDQTHSTFPRAMFFTHYITLGFLATMAYAAWGLDHPLSWGQEFTKAGFLYVTGFYFALTSREAEHLRKKFHDSIEMTRVFNRRLVSQAEELRLAREQAVTARVNQSAFLAATSHDLRTPLNAILLYSELLREDAEAEGRAETVQDLKKIHGAGRHLLQLLNDLLDLAKVEAGKMTFFLETVNVADLLAEIQDLAGPLVAQKGNLLKLEVDPSLDTLVADSTRLRQVLLNLLSNAAKFTEKGEITLSLQTEHIDGKDWVIAEVRDTGLGMTPEQLGQLFQEYVQAEDSTTKKFGGTGLGLVLCRRLSALMGGDIQASSELGKGSTFTVRLPWQRRLEASPNEAEAEAPPATLPGKLEKRVLIIDDDQAIRDSLRRVFLQEGYEVKEAQSGEQGLEIAREVRPTLITLDVVMPGINGWTVLRMLKSDPALADIPVILVTMEGDRSQGFALGAAEYLPKPIDPRRFQEVLRRINPEAGSMLLVEDDEAQRLAMARVLEGAGWHVQTAVHGLDALRILEGGLVPDLILLDLRMPEMDGFEFMDVLHQRGLGKSIPVVVITSEDLGEEARSRLAHSGVRQVLPKSAYPREKLVDIVRDLARNLPEKR